MDTTNFLLLLLIALAVFQVVYQLIITIGLYLKNKKSDDGAQVAVSVIIAAQNEAKNLTENVYKWLEQEQVDFEIILVNDRSWDDTEEVMKNLSAHSEKITYTNVREEMRVGAGKKFALTLGVKKAKYDNLFFTDADCIPNSKLLLKRVSMKFAQGNNLILGYAPFNPAPGFLSLIQQYENLSTAISYFALTKLNRPYMGVGRFLGYTKELYQKVGGYKGHYQIPFGDDDLFVQSVKGIAQVGIIKPKFHVLSNVKTTFSAWWKQRKRHLSAGKYYSNSDKLILSIPTILQALFWIAFVVSLWGGCTVLPWIVLGGRMAVGTVLGFVSGQKFRKPLLGAFTPFLELIIFIIHPLIYLSAILNPTKRW